MAKKKRKRNRRPVAPPVHSAPEAVHGPAGPRSADAPPARPFAPEPPATRAEPETYSAEAAPVRARPAGRRRPTGRKRRRLRPYVITAAIVAAIIGAIVIQQVNSRRQLNEFNELARANGCSELRVTGGSGSGQHLRAGAVTRYDTSPPTHGAHDGGGVVTAGLYEKPFGDDPEEQPSIFRAVHSLEHGYIIVWHDGLTRDQNGALERAYRNERKVIVVPYPELRGDTKLAMTAWGRIVTCERPSTRVIDEFIERFREARSAPEPNGA